MADQSSPRAQDSGSKSDSKAVANDIKHVELLNQLGDESMGHLKHLSVADVDGTNPMTVAHNLKCIPVPKKHQNWLNRDTNVITKYMCCKDAEVHVLMSLVPPGSSSPVFYRSLRVHWDVLYVASRPFRQMLIDAQDSMLQDISAKKPQPVKHVWLDLRGYHMIAMDDILSILHNKPPTEPRGIAERSFLMAVYATRFDVMQHVRDTLNKWLVSKVPTVDRPVGESPTMDQVIVMLMASLIVDNVDAAKMWYWVLLTRYSSDYASALLDHSNWAVSHQYYGQEEWENINEFLNPEFLNNLEKHRSTIYEAIRETIIEMTNTACPKCVLGERQRRIYNRMASILVNYDNMADLMKFRGARPYELSIDHIMQTIQALKGNRELLRDLPTEKPIMCPDDLGYRNLVREVYMELEETLKMNLVREDPQETAGKRSAVGGQGVGEEEVGKTTNSLPIRLKPAAEDKMRADIVVSSVGEVKEVAAVKRQQGEVQDVGEKSAGSSGVGQSGQSNDGLVGDNSSQKSDSSQLDDYVEVDEWRPEDNKAYKVGLKKWGW